MLRRPHADLAYKGKTVGQWFQEMQISKDAGKSEALDALVAIAESSTPFLIQELGRIVARSTEIQPGLSIQLP